MTDLAKAHAPMRLAALIVIEGQQRFGKLACSRADRRRSRLSCKMWPAPRKKRDRAQIGADSIEKSCLLYPEKRTCAVQGAMSAKGQKRTYKAVPLAYAPW